MSARLLHDTLSRLFGLLEMQGQGSIGPGVVELVAPVRAENNFNAEFLSCLGKVARLIAQLAGKNE
ncbi:MAG: hypothetical protein DMG29_15360 [Acidobacteria bacterium]|nr:MAG: hypothetical protein DMG29_15360 [Acidobacteriota bacterium]